MEGAKLVVGSGLGDRVEPEIQPKPYIRSSICFLGTFANFYLNKNNLKMPPFLLHDNYPRKIKTKDKFTKLTSLEKRVFVESQTAGKKGRAGLEISARLDNRLNELFLILDLRNTSKVIQVLQAIDI